MFDQKYFYGAGIGVLALALLAQPAQAHEWDREKHYRPYYVNYHYPACGEIVVFDSDVNLAQRKCPGSLKDRFHRPSPGRFSSNPLNQLNVYIG